jgi:tRNA/rRNA methyltransferase
MSLPTERATPLPLHQTDPQALARVAFVLVGTSHPGNVGAAARAMKTMGLSQLRLVTPRYADVCSQPEAIAFASGATDVLAGARRFDSLADALADVSFAVAVSAEPREFGPPPAPPEVCAAKALASLAERPEHRAAFVFGAERTGLSIESVQSCHLLTSIPASPVYSSLNLAQAIQIVAYCLRREALSAASSEADSSDRPRPATPTVAADEIASPMASGAAIQGFFDHLERALLAIGYLDPLHPKKLMPRMRRLFLRTRLSAEEVDLLRGICKLMERGRASDGRPARIEP